MNRRRLLRRTFALGAVGIGGCDWMGSPLSDVRIGICGFHGKGMHHIKDLVERSGVRITALCDVDGRVMEKGLKEVGGKVKPTSYTDYREFVNDPQIDGVIIATPNHSHTLIAMHAIAAGKHVYVEKPVSHNIVEGAKLVAAARARPQLIVTHGMQLRSDEGRDEAFAWLREGHLGPLTLSRGLNFKARESIGKLSEPRRIPSFLDYDLWSACRELKPMMRSKSHYDWHWQWDYGNGDIGNQGPHQLDVARWALDQGGLPRQVMSIGRRWGYVDDGETPNNQLALFDYQPVPLLFDNRGLPLKDMDWRTEPVYEGIRIGNVVHCQEGMLAESRAFDAKGRQVKKFSISGGADHMSHWLQSIREGRYVSPHMDIEHGHLSAALAHLANLSHRVGGEASPEEIRERVQGKTMVLETLGLFEENLRANGIDWSTNQAILGPWLNLNPDTLKFEGEFADEANALIDEHYREGHQLPIVS